MDKQSILEGLSAYDRPNHSDLPHLGVIEFLWHQIVECLYVDECPTWKGKIQELEVAIGQRCPDNCYKIQAIAYLKQLDEHILNKNYWEVAVVLENTKDWARKSIIRK